MIHICSYYVSRLSLLLYPIVDSKVNGLAPVRVTVRSCGVHSRFPAVSVSLEAAGFTSEVQGMFQELDGAPGAEPLAGACSPAIDVYEHDDAVHIVVDVPGVDRSRLRVVAKADMVLIVGEKTVRRPRAESSFHLVERDFGRFARTVRLARACDTRKAWARLVNGELDISLPKITERRGQRVRIAVE